MNGRDIKGRIYLSSQGINAQYTGAWDDAVAYPKWLEEQSLFQVSVHVDRCRNISILLQVAEGLLFRTALFLAVRMVLGSQ